MSNSTFSFTHAFKFSYRRTYRGLAGLIGGLSFAIPPGIALSASPAIAQANPQANPPVTSPAGSPAGSQTDSPANPLPPTARYANGEDIDLADVIAEWRGYYADVPVYLCVCQDDTCDQTGQWPYREYDRYQFSVALGPTSGSTAEAAGSNCFDIADGSRPSTPRAFSAAQTGGISAAPASPPTDVPEPPSASSAAAPSAVPSATSSTDSIPTATTIDDGAGIRLDWPSGTSDVLTVADGNWSVTVLNALDCESLSVVESKMMAARQVVGEPVVDENTGYVAVPVLLETCIEVDQMAVFVINPAEGGGYTLYRTQLPSARGPLQTENPGFPDEFSSYAYSTIVGLRYWNSTLLVRQASASGAEVISLFRSGQTPAGVYSGCGIVSAGEGVTALCDR